MCNFNPFTSRKTIYNAVMLILLSLLSFDMDAQCSGTTTSIFFNKLDGGTDIAIVNGGVYQDNVLSNLYNIESNNSGTLQSVKFTITGPTASINIENTAPYNAPGTGVEWNPAPGAYTVNVRTYSEDNAAGTQCQSVNFTFTISSADCNCPGNLVLNPSFESGTTSWTAAGPYNAFLSDAFGAQCGSKAGQQDGTSNSNLASFYQDVTLAGGTSIQLKFYAGTHVAADVAKFGVIFFNGTSRLDSSLVDVDHILGAGTMNLYTINTTAPASATKVRIIGKTGADWLKVDQICLTATCSTTSGTIAANQTICSGGNPVAFTSTVNSAVSTGTMTIQWEKSTDSINFTAITGTNTQTYDAPALTQTTWYRRKVTSSAGCSSYSNKLKVTVVSSATAGTDGATTVCENSAQITLANFITGESAGGSWFRTGGTGGTFTAATGKFTPNLNAITSTFIFVISGSGACLNDTSKVTVTVKNVGTPVVASGNQNLCINTTAQYCAVTTTGTQYYEWDFGSGATPSTSKLRCVDVQWSTTGTKTVKLYLISNDNCVSDTISYPVTVTSCTCPDAGTNGSTVVCENSAEITLANHISGEASGGSWTRATGTGGTFTAATGKFRPNNNATTSTFKYVIVGGSGCPNDTSIATVTVKNVGTPAVASGSQTVCSNTSTEFCAVTESGTQYYEWDFGAGATPSTSKLRCVNVQWSSAGTKTVKLYLISNDNCYSDTISYPVNVTSCACSGQVTSLYFNKLSGGADLPIVNKSSYSLATLSNLYNLEATTTGTVGSVRFTVSGATSGTNLEMSVPWNHPGTSTAWQPVEGTNYINVKAYQNSDGTGLCDSHTDTIYITNPGCDCPNNIITNPSFEDGGGSTTGWSSTVSGTFYAGTGFDVCGSYNAFLDARNATASNPYWFWQDKPATPGGLYNLTIYGGTHEPSLNHAFLLIFLNSSGVKLGQDSVQVNYDVDIAPYGLQQYSLSGTAPSGTATVRIAGRGVGDYLKVDLVCLTYTAGSVASIGDKVFMDNNANGQQDGGEAGIANVIVKLLNSSSVVIARDTTDANGDYGFFNLVPGTYSIDFDTPAGYIQTTPNIGDDATDSDAGVNGITGTYTLAGNQNNTTVDAGYYMTASLGDKVFLDANADGQQAVSGEPGIAGVIVKLLNSGGTEIARDTTDANGLYRFNNLMPGIYSVDFDTPSGGYSQTSPNSGSDDTDSDAGVNGITGTYTLVGGQNNTTVDAGYFNTASIGDKVFLDVNADGQQGGSGEPGIAGVIVKLLNSGGTVIARDTTDGNGIYGFSNLVPGTYSIDFDTPAGYIQTTSNSGDDVTDSDAGVNGITGTYTLVGNQNNTTVDAGYYLTASLGDKVFLDVDADGQQAGSGEPGIAGVIVKLLNISSVVIARDTTDANGIYGFTNLMPGTYSIDFDTPAGGFTQTIANSGDDNTDSDAGVNGVTGFYTLVGGQTNNTVDAGYYRPAAIGDRIWVDTDADGIQDGVETNYTGSIVVNLYYDANKDGLINGTEASIVFATQTTATGIYNFTGLTPGNYQVGFVLPSGQTFSPADATGDAADSDADTLTGRTAITNLTSGETDNTFDVGLVEIVIPPYQFASLGDKVWLDVNANGLQDGGVEVGIPGVIVKLLNDLNVVIARDTTDANGVYGFPNLNHGVTYRVDFDGPSGYIPSAANAGNDDFDSDAGVNGVTGPYILNPSENNTSVDAGFNCNAVLTFNPITICGVRVNLRLLEPAPYQGGTWRRSTTGSIVANPLSVPAGIYNYTDTTAEGCIATGSVQIINTVPDYTPTLTLLPSTITGISPVHIVIEVKELLNQNSCGEVFVAIPTFIERFTFTWSMTLGSVPDPSGGPAVTVMNSDWLFLGEDGGFYRWKYVGGTGNFPPGGVSRLGILGIYDNQGSSGYTSFGVEILQGSGGELNGNNNAASKQLIYNN